MTPAHNIYIHVPYCMSKCNYCAFFSRACAMPDWDKYCGEIVSEIEFWATKLGKITVPTIFFGGGTPSLMPVKIFATIMDSLRKYFCIMPDAEITMESNPGTLDAARLNDFISAGINRLSVGVQSFNDDKLRFLGRRHNAADARQLISAAMQRGLRVSGDFIYGMPGDTVHDVIETCHQINDMGLRHCSLYELTIEPGTPFAKMNLDMPTNEEMAEMYMAIGENLALPRYEVSNYAAPNQECRHNQNVWDGAPYIGIGRGAAGRIYIAGQWYEQLGANARFEKINSDARATEKIITGMRTMRGVKLTTDVIGAISRDFVAAHPDLIETKPDGRIAATQKGLLILDDLLVNLCR